MNNIEFLNYAFHHLRHSQLSFSSFHAPNKVLCYMAILPCSSCPNHSLQLMLPCLTSPSPSWTHLPHLFCQSQWNFLLA